MELSKGDPLVHPCISVLRKQRQEDWCFEASLEFEQVKGQLELHRRPCHIKIRPGLGLAPQTFDPTQAGS